MPKSDIVLITSPPYKRSFRDSRQQPSLGLAFIAAHLRNQGIGCAIIDAYTFRMEVKAVVDQVLEKAPRLIGLTTSTEDRFSAIELIRALKQALPQCLIVAGGPHFSHSAKDALQMIPELDFVCRGEGEQFMAELYEAVCGGGGDLSGVAGLVYRRSGETVQNPRSKAPVDFNTLSPAWDLFDLNRYQGMLTLADHTRAMGVVSSRGCDNTCVFCANSLNRRVRYKEPVRFVDEVEELIRERGFQGVNIQDDSFTSDFGHVKGICEEILRRDLRMKWFCSLRIDEVTRPMLELMKAAGCVGLGFGIESGSDVILKNVRKGTTTAMILDVLDMVQEIGFPHLGLFVITSLPGDTPETFLLSQHFLNGIYGRVHPGWQRQSVLGSLAQIYPGTGLEVLAKRNGMLDRDFSWNSPYLNPKHTVFGTNPYVPHFENPEFSLEAIRQLVDEKFSGMPVYIC